MDIQKNGGLTVEAIARFKTGWVWAIGKTFHSGYLNIPVNLFYSSGREGGYVGLSMGFNITKKD